VCSLLLCAFHNEFAYSPSIGLAAHRLHHGTDNRAGCLDFTVTNLLEHAGLCCQRFIDGSDKGALVGNNGKATRSDDILSSTFSVDHALDDLTRQLVVERTRFHEFHNL